jgi:hypothetical protein
VEEVSLKTWLDTVRIVFLFLGVGFIFYATRYLDGQPLGKWLNISGVSLVVVFFLLGLFAYRQAKTGPEKASRAVLLRWSGAFVLSLATYGIYRWKMGAAAEPESMLQKILLGLWLPGLIISSFWGIGCEWAFRVSGRGRFAEPQRVARAGGVWVLVGILLSTVIALNYVSVRKNKSWDWSYLKTASVSESTVNMLANLEKDLEVGLFFSNTNEVFDRVQNYFEADPLKNPKIKVSYYDAEINPNAAETFKASRNGQIILKYGDASERIEMGTTLTSARKNLRNMDAEFQKALLAVTQKRKVLYFSRGHGELDWSGANEDPLRTLKLLEGYLRGQNYTLKYFGVGEGSTKAVPEDADGVVVVGGTSAMLAEEALAISDYLDRGGAVFALLDMDAPKEGVLSKISRNIVDDPFHKLLASRGVAYEPTPLANAANFVAATRSDADTWFLYSNVFTSHESVVALARNDQRAAILTFRSGFLKVTSEMSGWQSFETVRSLSDTFADENRDFKYTEPNEKRNPYVLGVASVQKEQKAGSPKKGRLVVFADASAVSDLLLRNQGNLIYLIESLRWSIGDNAAASGAGVASTEEDVRIQHSRKEDLAWFYGTVLLVPLLVLGAGFFATRRTSRKQLAGAP